MVWFGILDCPIFMSWRPHALLLADILIMTVSCIVASGAKTFSWS
jgi:hypothetical protein